MTMHNPFFAADQMSLAELRARIEADHELSVYKRRDIASACRSLAEWFHLPEASIPASAPYIREKLERVHPTLINVTRRRVQNVRSLILGAMRHLKINTKLAPASAKLTAEWQVLYDLLTGDTYPKSELSRFMRYCSNQGIAPGSVSDVVSDGYLAALEAESLIKHPRVRHQSTCRVWNQMVEKHFNVGWPQVTLKVPRYEDRLYAIDWALVSDAVRADIDAYLDHLASKDVFSKGLKKPFAPISIDAVRGQLHRYISALSYQGVDVGRAQSLRDLVTPAMFKTGINWLLERNGGETSKHIGELAWSVRCYAVKHCDPSDEDVAFFAEHMPKLRRSHDGLSEKNAASMHQFDDPKAVLRFLTLPQVLWDRALSMSKTVETGSVRKDAHLLIQAAVAIEILQFAPMRIRNLDALRLDQHFIWHGKCLRIVVPMEEVKNKVALALLLYTGQRRSDVVRMGPQHVKDGYLNFTQEKNKARKPVKLSLPILPELQHVLDQTDTGHLSFLVTQHGRPFTANGFGNWFRKQCDAAGLKHCSAHGLRKAGAAIAAENGATERQLMAMFGWSTLKEASRYTRSARQKILATAGMQHLSRHQNEPKG